MGRGKGEEGNGLRSCPWKGSRVTSTSKDKVQTRPAIPETTSLRLGKPSFPLSFSLFLDQNHTSCIGATL